MRCMDRLASHHIKQILAVTDALHIHRESVAVPLAPRGEGGVRLTETQRLEIVAPATLDFDTWLASLPVRIRGLDLSRVRRSE
jgi:hypothetical protein